MPGPFQTFTGNSISPGQSAYASLSLTGSISLAWPNFAGVGTNVIALIMDLTANAGGYSITFPDARQAGNGTSVLLFNKGSQSITILANDGSALTTVAAGVAKFLYLADNSTQAGTWTVVTFGTGTSAADATALAGFGLQAIAATLNQSHPTATTASTITVAAPADLAKVYVAVGGSVAANFPSSASAGPNFFTIIKNNGTGTVTLTPSGADTMDGVATVALAPNDAAMICSLGSSNGWVTIGLGRSVSFAFTQLVKNVAGSADVTLTAGEAANKLITLTGVLTGNINVIVPNTVSVYYIFNNTSGAFNVTIKTAAGSGMSVAQGTHDIAACDGTNVYRALTNTAATTAFSAGSAGAPSVTFIGSTDSGLYLAAAHVPGISASGFEVMSFNGPAGSVNWLDAFASATGVAPSIVANGTDASIGLTLKMKGTGAAALVSIQDGSGATVGVFSTVASALNYLQHGATATGVNPTIIAKGETNVGIRLIPKGTGKVQFADGSDTTKVVALDASSVTTGTTRTLTAPDASGTIQLTTPAIGTISGNTTLTSADVNTLKNVTAAADITLPDVATLSTGAAIKFKSSTEQKVRLLRQGADTIDGDVEYLLPSYCMCEVMKTAANTYILSVRPEYEVGFLYPNTVAGNIARRGFIFPDGTARLRTTYGGLYYASTLDSGSGGVTMTIASPCVVTWASNKLQNNDPIEFSTTGALPTGIVAGTTYYVVSNGVDGAGKFRVAATIGGAAINTSGTQSGSHAGLHIPYGRGDGSTTFNVVDIRGTHPIGRDALGGTAAARVTAAGSGVNGDTPGVIAGDQRLHLHSHGVTDPTHTHVEMYGQSTTTGGQALMNAGVNQNFVGQLATADTTAASGAGISVNNAGAGNSQNMSPLTVTSWLVKT